MIFNYIVEWLIKEIKNIYYSKREEASVFLFYIVGNRKDYQMFAIKQLRFPDLRQCNVNTAMKNNLYKYISEPYKKKTKEG